MQVALVRLSALGDVIHTWPLATALKEADPSIRLSWVVEESFAPVVAGHPAVDETITVATRRWRRQLFSGRTRRETATLRRRFRELQPDLCLDTQGVAKSALATYWSGATRRVGLARPWRREALAGLAYTHTLRVSAERPHVVRTNLEFVRTVGGVPPHEPPPPDGSWLLAAHRDAASPVTLAEPYAVILPGAGNAVKMIATSTLATLSRGLVQRGLRVVAAWGPGEKQRAEQVVQSAGEGALIAPPTDLIALAVLLSRARIVVGADTGPVHLSASLHVPTVSVFTATNPARNRPLGKNVAVVSTVSRWPATVSGSARTGVGRGATAEEILAAVDGLVSPPPEGELLL